MTYNNRLVAENLRKTVRKLKDQLEAVTNKVKEWDLTHQRDKHAAPSILADLEEMLGLESAKK